MEPRCLKVRVISRISIDFGGFNSNFEEPTQKMFILLVFLKKIEHLQILNI